eukprot:CAMPEP_0176053876 /NCGR_PEP_ID=MMETSP0120_2-20121206/26802_1 /TAXON_ID=160619 /ORGANISM="Kryptoperidinium foliaceum, Strain CCMP 1326" /LENGTH=76 /DNA_ID=CAMNT_0017387337 /DNA_START=208 /DNA_END=435 /DNA_ORIENTATION=+
MRPLPALASDDNLSAADQLPLGHQRGQLLPQLAQGTEDLRVRIQGEGSRLHFALLAHVEEGHGSARFLHLGELQGG